jgi:demethylmenaquinone methyltransferase / 2-methoxy-6-polyprenyl-1,4-benzoquinol methylase
VITPYQTSESKKEQVARMFNNIAPKYDFLNHFLSWGIDKIWRRIAINELKKSSPAKILDIATGTGDLALTALRIKPSEIVGIDISEEMLAIARTKIEKAGKSAIIRFEKGDSEEIQFPDDTFDAAIVAFGVRNFENLQKGINEIFRVLKPGAKFVVLEFSRPRNLFFRTIYNFYIFKIVPFFGKLFSKDKMAYTYLPESAGAFPSGDDFLRYLENPGFGNLTCRPLTFGVASVYSGIKPKV